MNEIEQFEYISGKIWYTHKRYPDIKLEIFTQEFMDKFTDYCIINYAWLNTVAWDKTELIENINLWLLSHLDNPTEFLFNLIK